MEENKSLFDRNYLGQELDSSKPRPQSEMRKRHMRQLTQNYTPNDLPKKYKRYIDWNAPHKIMSIQFN